MKKPRIKTLLTALYDQYQIVNSKVKYLNQGGCGVFAEGLFDVLTALGYKPTICIITPNKVGMTKRVNNDDTGWASCTHMIIKVGKYYIDSTGVYNSITSMTAYHGYGYQELFVGISIDITREWNNNPYQWNDSFNRRQIVTVKKILEKSKKKVAKKFGVSENNVIFAS